MSEYHNLTYNEAVTGITSFIEVAIHTILYVRHVYPAELFVRRKIYDTAVYQSRHPALNDYISEAMKAIAEELALGNVDKVVVIIKDKDHVALERFLFAVENMVNVDASERDLSFEDSMTTATVGKYFRSFLVKLSMIESQLGRLDLGDDASFAILLELKDDNTPIPTIDNEPHPWMPAEFKHTTAGVSEDSELSMIRAVNTGVINLAMAVQESEVKLSRKKGAPTDITTT